MTNNILNGAEIIPNGDSQLTVKVPLRLTEKKLEILVEVAKAFGETLPELIEDSINQDIRCQLESSGIVGEALNKTLCDTWLREIGENPEEGA
jgi:hypothetical protein